MKTSNIVYETHNSYVYIDTRRTHTTPNQGKGYIWLHLIIIIDGEIHVLPHHTNRAVLEYSSTQISHTKNTIN